MYTYYISYGSNMGDRKQYIDTALGALESDTDICHFRNSSCTETKPWGYVDQDKFLNGVCSFKSERNPRDILIKLQALEKSAKREHTQHWGPRTLDLDIILVIDKHDQLVSIYDDDLIVPHPYFWERTFVLMPLEELWPAFFYHGQSISSRIEELVMESIPFYKDPFKDIGRKMNLLVRTGRILMEKGASTDKIVEDIIRAAVFMGIPKNFVHVNVTYNTVMVSVVSETKSYTNFLKAFSYSTDMTIVTDVTRLTWRALEKNYSLDEYESMLEAIARRKPMYPSPLVAVLVSLACASLTILFGGSEWAACVTWVCTFVGYVVFALFRKWRVNGFINIAAGAFASNSIALLYYVVTGEPEGMTYGMISSSLFLMPGVLLINAVDDMLNNYFMAGLGRSMHTLLSVGFMTSGIMMAIHVNPKVAMSSLSILPTDVNITQIMAAALVGTGFSTMFNAPLRTLPFIALGGAVAVGTRNMLLAYGDLSVVVATLMAALVIGVLMMRVAHMVNTTAGTLAIPSIVTMFPGVLLYRFAYSLMQSSHLDVTTFWISLQSGITGIMIVFCMTVGVATPSLVAKKLLSRQKKKRLAALVARRMET